MLLIKGLIRTYGPYLAVLIGVVMFAVPATTLGLRAAFISEVFYCVVALFGYCLYLGLSWLASVMPKKTKIATNR